MKPAERQARHRARLRQPAQSSPPTSVRRSLPDYRTWLDSVPGNPEGSSLAEKRQAITEIDLDELQRFIHPAATAATDAGRFSTGATRRLRPKT
jgi:hypothetical protein